MIYFYHYILNKNNISPQTTLKRNPRFDVMGFYCFTHTQKNLK